MTCPPKTDPIFMLGSAQGDRSVYESTLFFKGLICNEPAQRFMRRVSCLSFFMPANVKEFLVQFWCSWPGRHGNYRKNGPRNPCIWLLHRLAIPYIGGGRYRQPPRVAYTEHLRFTRLIAMAIAPNTPERPLRAGATMYSWILSKITGD
jgi:hypothetical protein